MFVDTHCHLYKEYYDNLDSVLKSAKFNEVGYYINNGCNKESNKEVVDIISKYDNMYGAIGIHPESVLDYKIEDIKYIEDNISNEKIVAIGEIGLDYHYSKENKDEQIELFNKQLKIAEENNIPVIVHSRDATMDTINILKKYNVGGVIHSFSGSYEVALIYINMGFLLGINGVVTFKNANIKEVIKKVGLSNIVLETDSPYLTPEPFRGTKNSPKYIFNIAMYISSLFNISLEELANITNNNIIKLFKKVSIK